MVFSVIINLKLLKHIKVFGAVAGELFKLLSVCYLFIVLISFLLSTVLHTLNLQTCRTVFWQTDPKSQEVRRTSYLCAGVLKNPKVRRTYIKCAAFSSNSHRSSSHLPQVRHTFCKFSKTKTESKTKPKPKPKTTFLGFIIIWL